MSARHGKNVQCDRYPSLRSRTGAMLGSIGTERLECSEHNEDGRPTVVKREGKMDEKFIIEIGRCMELLDDIINVLEGNCR
jgi:hypothetical protein